MVMALEVTDNVSYVSEMLLDDFLLTYLVFMSTHDLCQALLGQYPYWQTHTNVHNIAQNTCISIDVRKLDDSPDITLNFHNKIPNPKLYPNLKCILACTIK